MRRRRAVEMLGAVSVIATDKTGTLTENRMRATKFWPATQTTRLLTVGVVCNDVAVDGLGAAGDPLDRALVEAAQARGVDVDALRAAHSLVDEYSFDSARQRMSVTVRRGRRLWVTVKGAPESVLEVCTTVLVGDAAKPLTNKRRAAVLRTLTGSGGLRVVALAEKESNAPSLSQAEAEAKLTFLGLVGMQDPLRRDVPEAIASCRAAGIRTVIVSGDHPETVGAIAGELGFPTSDGVLTGQDLETLGATAFRETVDQHSVFARTTPEQKLRIVRALTEEGHHVAATGDGINDAPALAAAQVGVAMGQTGTDVARQAADMVLMDDSFATLERSIRQCRGLFANLEKGIRYYLACKIALVASYLWPFCSPSHSRFCRCRSSSLSCSWISRPRPASWPSPRSTTSCAARRATRASASSIGTCPGDLHRRVRAICRRHRRLLDHLVWLTQRRTGPNSCVLHLADRTRDDGPPCAHINRCFGSA